MKNKFSERLKGLRRDVVLNVVSLFKNVVLNALRLNKTKTKTPKIVLLFLT